MPAGPAGPADRPGIRQKQRKFARPSAIGVVRSFQRFQRFESFDPFDPFEDFEDYLNIMNSLNLINLLINRAREGALGTLFSKRPPPTSSRATVVAPFWPPEPPQGEHPSIFWRPKRPSKIDRFSDPSKSTKVGDKVRPLAALWPPRAPFGSILGSILGTIFATESRRGRF